MKQGNNDRWPNTFWFDENDIIPDIKSWLSQNLRKKRKESKRYNYIVHLDKRFGRIINSRTLGVKIYNQNDLIMFKLAWYSNNT